MYCYTAQQIYQLELIIIPIFTYCGSYTSLGWSESHKHMIRSVESQSLENISFLGALIFNLLPLSLRNINSGVLFRKAIDDYNL